MTVCSLFICVCVQPWPQCCPLLPSPCQNSCEGFPHRPWGWSTWSSAAPCCQSRSEDSPLYIHYTSHSELYPRYRRYYTGHWLLSNKNQLVLSLSLLGLGRLLFVYLFLIKYLVHGRHYNTPWYNRHHAHIWCSPDQSSLASISGAHHMIPGAQWMVSGAHNIISGAECVVSGAHLIESCPYTPDEVPHALGNQLFASL